MTAILVDSASALGFGNLGEERKRFWKVNFKCKGIIFFVAKVKPLYIEKSMSIRVGPFRRP